MRVRGVNWLCIVDCQRAHYKKHKVTCKEGKSFWVDFEGNVLPESGTTCVACGAADAHIVVTSNGFARKRGEVNFHLKGEHPAKYPVEDLEFLPIRWRICGSCIGSELKDRSKHSLAYKDNTMWGVALRHRMVVRKFFDENGEIVRIDPGDKFTDCRMRRGQCIELMNRCNFDVFPITQVPDEHAPDQQLLNTTMHPRCQVKSTSASIALVRHLLPKWQSVMDVKRPDFWKLGLLYVLRLEGSTQIVVQGNEAPKVKH